VKKNLPGLQWTMDDVIGRCAGARMLQAADESSLSAVTREFEVVQPRPRLIMHIGGKYTTSRSDSTEIVDAVFKALGRKAPPSRTGVQPLPGAPPAGVPFAQWVFAQQTGLVAAGVDLEAAHWMAQRYGEHCGDLLALIRERPELAARIHPEAPFVLAEVVRSVRDEMACNVDDVVRRRMPLSLLVRDGAWRARVGKLVDESRG
jgi:glycerol-3-phosphate dehydrogenase